MESKRIFVWWAGAFVGGLLAVPTVADEPGPTLSTADFGCDALGAPRCGVSGRDTFGSGGSPRTCSLAGARPQTVDLGPNYPDPQVRQPEPKAAADIDPRWRECDLAARQTDRAAVGTQTSRVAGWPDCESPGADIRAPATLTGCQTRQCPTSLTPASLDPLLPQPLPNDRIMAVLTTMGDWWSRAASLAEQAGSELMGAGPRAAPWASIVDLPAGNADLPRYAAMDAHSRPSLTQPAGQAPVSSTAPADCECPTACFVPRLLLGQDLHHTSSSDSPALPIVELRVLADAIGDFYRDLAGNLWAVCREAASPIWTPAAGLLDRGGDAARDWLAPWSIDLPEELKNARRLPAVPIEGEFDQ